MPIVYRRHIISSLCNFFFLCSTVKPLNNNLVIRSLSNTGHDGSNGKLSFLEPLGLDDFRIYARESAATMEIRSPELRNLISPNDTGI
ncbi:hypothetical protein CDAR_273171 [Caerostris darwini]|uniref:Secreted protein n=1 Tax=Caerostris darwini TaxID=1538125 RepID=A0AAV4MIF4_9ARAC|nr:hypothetical protein CDAR_273171 [Caerostris darwini]